MTNVIGLTGGIATGKSVVSKYLIQKGYFVIDADQMTHDLQKKGQTAYSKIVAYFGKEYLLNSGELNRAKLAKHVFSNQNELKVITQIMDYELRSNIKQLIDMHSNENNIFLDAPTLFETGYEKLVDQTILVYCNSVNQFARLIKRDGLSYTDANDRLKSQWSLDIKIRLADNLINNNDSIEQTRKQIDQFLMNLR